MVEHESLWRPSKRVERHAGVYLAIGSYRNVCSATELSPECPVFCLGNGGRSRELFQMVTDRCSIGRIDAAAAIGDVPSHTLTCASSDECILLVPNNGSDACYYMSQWVCLGVTRPGPFVAFKYNPGIESDRLV